MITLTAEINLKGKINYPFILGESTIDHSFFGYDYHYMTEIIDKKNIISMESEIRDRAEIGNPSFGLISSGGKLSFRDIDSVFLNHLEDKGTKGNDEIIIYLNNEATNAKEQVGSYFITNWEYDKENMIVSASFSDNITDAQGEFFNSKNSVSEETAENLIIYAFNNSKVLFYEESEEFKEILSNTKIKYPILKDLNVWSLTNSVCGVCGLCCYKNKKGETSFSKSL